jgi:hypothetical protein
MDQGVINQIITILIIPILPTLVKFIVSWFSAKTQEAQARIKREEFHKYIFLLNDAVEETVNALNQTTVEALKEVAQDGKLTQEQIDNLKKQAIMDVYDILSEKGVEVLKDVYQDLDHVISTKIESFIKKTKSN